MSRATTTTDPVVNRFKRKLHRFEQAIRDHAFKGMQPPSDHEEIDNELRSSRAALYSFLNKQVEELNLLRGTVARAQQLTSSASTTRESPT